MSAPADVQAEAERTCREVYAETAQLYAELAPQMGRHAFGYKILYGPPIVGAPILFIGFNPGGGASDASKGEAAGERTGWPDNTEYATADYNLAFEIRDIWGKELASRSTGLNVNFFRTPDTNAFKVPSKRLRDFSRKRAEKIVRTLRPKQIAVIGLGTTPDFRANKSCIVPVKLRGQDEKRMKRVAELGSLWGFPACTVRHLTGKFSRPNHEEKEAIKQFVAARGSIMEKPSFHVAAVWDDAAGVFTSESDIPGLVVEAASFDEFVDLVRALAADLITANVPHLRPPYRIDVCAHRPGLLAGT